MANDRRDVAHHVSLKEVFQLASDRETVDVDVIESDGQVRGEVKSHPRNDEGQGKQELRHEGRGPFLFDGDTSFSPPLDDAHRPSRKQSNLTEKSRRYTALV